MDVKAPVQDWLRGLPGFEGTAVLGYHPAEGGASNVTYRVELEGAPLGSVAIRVQGERGIFEPYDVIKEGRVLRALDGSDVPVPKVLGEEPDATVLGSPFLAIEWVDAPHMGVAGPEASFEAFTEMVARIHRVDWQDRELGFLGVPDSAAAGVQADLRIWNRRMERFSGADNETLRDALGVLRRTVPDDGELAFCHGDINVFNYLFRNQAVASVVDWEEARIGDVRYDVGQLVALSHLKGAPFGPAADQGFVRAYEYAAEKSLANMEYFRALWLFQLGVIYFGWVEFGGSEPWYSWPDVSSLLRLALAEL